MIVVLKICGGHMRTPPIWSWPSVLLTRCVIYKLLTSHFSVRYTWPLKSILCHFYSLAFHRCPAQFYGKYTVLRLFTASVLAFTLNDF